MLRPNHPTASGGAVELAGAAVTLGMIRPREGRAAA